MTSEQKILDPLRCGHDGRTSRRFSHRNEDEGAAFKTRNEHVPITIRLIASIARRRSQFSRALLTGAS